MTNQTDKIRASLTIKLKKGKTRLGIIDRSKNVLITKIKNFCDENIQCWCEISALDDSELLPGNGWYNKDHSWDLQPFGESSGHVKLFNLFASFDRSGETHKEIKFLVKFSYQVYGKEEVFENVPLKFKYHWKRNKLIYDY